MNFFVYRERTVAHSRRLREWFTVYYTLIYVRGCQWHGSSIDFEIWKDFDRALSLICRNKTPTRCNRWFLLQILLLAQHVSGTITPIIRSSRVFYRWLLPVVFGALVFNLQQPANGTHNPQLHTIPTTWKPKHQIPQAANTCKILSSSWWWA